MSDFINDCINGDALLEEVDDYIDTWHDSPSTLEIYEYLGMTEEEYTIFLADSSMIKYIVEAHRLNKNIKELLLDYSNMSLAARSNGTDSVESMVAWLRSIGKIQ